MVNRIEILARFLSDHWPIVWRFKINQGGSYRWKLNENLLEKKDNIDILRKRLKNFSNPIGTEELKIILFGIPLKHI